MAFPQSGGGKHAHTHTLTHSIINTPVDQHARMCTRPRRCRKTYGSGRDLADKSVVETILKASAVGDDDNVKSENKSTAMSLNCLV